MKQEVLTAAQAREKTFEHLGNEDSEFQQVMKQIHEEIKSGNFRCYYWGDISYQNILKLKDLGYDIKKEYVNFNESPEARITISW